MFTVASKEKSSSRAFNVLETLCLGYPAEIRINKQRKRLTNSHYNDWLSQQLKQAILLINGPHPKVSNLHIRYIIWLLSNQPQDVYSTKRLKKKTSEYILLRCEIIASERRRSLGEDNLSSSDYKLIKVTKVASFLVEIGLLR